jgi:hypothetical protein
MNDDRIDLSALDPGRNRGRWEARVNEVAARARALPQRRTVSHQLRAWARPVLAIAASLAIVSWAGALVRDRTPDANAPADPALELSRIAAEGETPPTGTILQLLGDGDGKR